MSSARFDVAMTAGTTVIDWHSLNASSDGANSNQIAAKNGAISASTASTAATNGALSQRVRKKKKKKKNRGASFDFFFSFLWFVCAI
jgi:hypothetical protein